MKSLMLMSMSEIIFEVSEDGIDGGYAAHAPGCGINTDGKTLEGLRMNVREAVDCCFDETMERPGMIRLHLVRDKVLTP